MGSVKENLRQAVKSGENLAISCKTYAQEAGEHPAAFLFEKMAADVLSNVREMKKELRKYC